MESKYYIGRKDFGEILPITRAGYCFNCRRKLPSGILEKNGKLPSEYKCRYCRLKCSRMIVWDPEIRQYFNETGSLIHESVGMIILNEERKILLFHRKKYPSAYTIPAGHIDVNEASKNAAIREVSEETGVSITDAVLIKEDIIIGDSCSRGADIHKWFLYASSVDKVKVELTDEGESYAWFDLDSLPENLTVVTKAFLNDIDVLAKLKEI